jgi:hypothetical protein
MQCAGLRCLWLLLRSQQWMLHTGKNGDVFPGHFTEHTGKHCPLLSFAGDRRNAEQLALGLGQQVGQAERIIDVAADVGIQQ